LEAPIESVSAEETMNVHGGARVQDSEAGNGPPLQQYKRRKKNFREKCVPSAPGTPPGVQINMYVSPEKMHHRHRVFTSHPSAGEAPGLRYNLPGQMMGFPMLQAPATGMPVGELVRGRPVTGRIVRKDLLEKLNGLPPMEEIFDSGSGDVGVNATGTEGCAMNAAAVANNEGGGNLVRVGNTDGKARKDRLEPDRTFVRGRKMSQGASDDGNSLPVVDPVVPTVRPTTSPPRREASEQQPMPSPTTVKADCGPILQPSKDMHFKNAGEVPQGDRVLLLMQEMQSTKEA
jgi:hypothetical protein